MSQVDLLIIKTANLIHANKLSTAYDYMGSCDGFNYRMSYVISKPLKCIYRPTCLYAVYVFLCISTLHLTN